jgi:F0F1-type ATP synthase assembly protein I
MWNSPAFGMLGIGSYLATTIVGLTLVGHFLDLRFETEPVLTLVFLVLGLTAGFYGAYRQLMQLIERTNRQNSPRE